MTSQQAQIQELIQSIDAVLSKASPRLPWVMAGDTEQQRQVLERTRQYLINLQIPVAAELPGVAIAGALPADPTLGPTPFYPPAPAPGESAQQVLQAVLQEVTYLRSHIMQPMRSDVDTLRQQRDALVHEIQELETQRQHYALPPQTDSQQQVLSEFLHSLMGRLQENLTVQVAEMLTSLEARALPPGSGSEVGGISPLTGSTTSSSYTLTPQERLEQLQRIQGQSDQLLLKLDTTLRVIFESLQRNIQTYEESLSQGLDKMHTLGHQGEAIFTAMVSRLAQQLGREASHYLQSSLETNDWQALPGASGRPLASPPAESSLSALDSLLEALNEREATILQPPITEPISSEQGDLDALHTELDSLELSPLNRELEDLDTSEMTMFQMDENLVRTRFQDDDMTMFQVQEPPSPLGAYDLDEIGVDSPIDDIDSALELLNQISTELDTDEDDPSQPSEVASPEGIYDELDALYQSLFGTDVALVDENAPPPVDRHVADAEQAQAEAIALSDWDAGERAEQMDDFESQFFEGLADLAEESAEAIADASPPNLAEPEAAEAAREQSTQTIEQLLFDEVPVADAGEQEDTQLLNASEAIGSQHPPADIISSLEDLIVLSESSSLDALRFDGLIEEDIYIPASPDEDLLVGEAVIENPRPDIQVDSATLQQLDAELSMLEGRSPDMDPERTWVSLPDRKPDPSSDTLDPLDSFLALGDNTVEPRTAETDPATPLQEPSAAAETLEDWAISAASPAAEPLDRHTPDPTELRSEFSDPMPPAMATDDAAEWIPDMLMDLALPLAPDAMTPEEVLPDVAVVDEWAEWPADAGDVDAAPSPPLEPSTPEESNLGTWQAYLIEPVEPETDPEPPPDQGSDLESWDLNLFEPVPDLPDLADSTPPPLVIEEADIPPFDDTPEATATLPPIRTLLTPDRENLTLENFQAVMATPPLTAEDLLGTWLEEGVGETTPEQNRPLASDPPETADFSPHAPLEAMGDQGFVENTLESFADDLNQAPNFPPLEDESLIEEGETTGALAAWFNGVEDMPEAIAVTPPGVPASDLLDLDLGADWADRAQTEPSMPDRAPEDNAFTLDGLGDLFEDLPERPLTEESASNTGMIPAAEPDSVEPATSEPDVSLEAAPPPPFETDLDQAVIDLYQQAHDPMELDPAGFDLSPEAEETADLEDLEAAEDLGDLETDPSKKKDLDVRPPEDLDFQTGMEIRDGDDSFAPGALDYTSEVILQAIGLGPDADLDSEDLDSEDLELPVETLEDPDLSLMDVPGDLVGSLEDELDPDLAALLQRLQYPPSGGADVAEPLGDRLAALRDQEDDLEALLYSVSDEMAQDLSPFAPPPLASSRRSAPHSPWHLGIDLGTTGISAVLFNRTTRTLYPLFWLEIKFPGPIHGSLPLPEKTYRLPTAVYATPEVGSGPEATHVAIASLHTPRHEFSHPSRQPLRDFKPALRAGIPYYTLDHPHWEPVLQWSDRRTITLSSLHLALRALLSSLNYTTPELQEGSDAPVLSCGAVGLDDATLQQALQHLAGISVSCPADWPDTYRFNLREAVLASRLVHHPDQIYLVEESIATLLSALQSQDAPAISLPDALSPRPDLFQSRWQGGTLVINGGASVTELALVNLPSHLQILSHRDFFIRTIPYGGNSLDHDIICQLIYPAWVRQAHRPGADPGAIAPEPEASVSFGPDLDWADPWAALGWEHLTLPVVGDPDLINRQIFQQRLLGASVGLGLLEAARHLKLALQQQDRCTLMLGNLPLTISRQDLGSRVLLPYIQRLNRELNGLLAQAGIPVLGVNQMLCSGGTASLAAIARWLRQKLPNATLVQDTYAPPELPHYHHLSACSRVAYGLAVIPCYAQVMDPTRHQYSDYFLLMELLRVFPDAPVTLNGLMQMLERRGIRTSLCQSTILALLDGQLPPGLVPTDWEAVMLTQASHHNPDYQALMAAPLFVRDDDQTYRPNPQQWQVFRRYMDTLLAASYQKLTEPLEFALGMDSEVMP